MNHMTTTTNPAPAFKTLTGAEVALLTRFAALRARTIGLNVEVGVAFTHDAAEGWRLSGFRGLAFACRALHDDLANIAGSWHTWVEARDLASACLEVCK